MIQAGLIHTFGCTFPVEKNQKYIVFGQEIPIVG